MRHKMTPKPSKWHDVFVTLDPENIGPILQQSADQRQQWWQSEKYSVGLRAAILATMFPGHTFTLYKDSGAQSPSMAVLLHRKDLEPHHVLGAVAIHPVIPLRKLR